MVSAATNRSQFVLMCNKIVSPTFITLIYHQCARPPEAFIKLHRTEVAECDYSAFPSNQRKTHVFHTEKIMSTHQKRFDTHKYLIILIINHTMCAQIHATDQF